MAKGPKPCQEPGCERPKVVTKHRCYWHYLLAQPIGYQEVNADERLRRWAESGQPRRSRVPKDEWPAGERWCSGCQHFVPTFYTSGSQCRACRSRAAHEHHILKTYGLTPEAYREILRLQEGRCFICQRVPRSRRLAVDHDHATGEVRGLLCSDDERGCNHAIIGNVKDVAMARRIVEYLEDPPARRISRGLGASQPPDWRDDPAWAL